MKMFVGLGKVYLHRQPVDFRKAINGLSAIVEQTMKISPFEDAIFVFCNRKKDKLKVLYWDRTGFALWHKRLDDDKFKWPTKLTSDTIELTEQQWHWLLAGYDIVNMKGHKKITYSDLGLGDYAY